MVRYRDDRLTRANVGRKAWRELWNIVIARLGRSIR
jgi:hypothetical protein